MPKEVTAYVYWPISVIGEQDEKILIVPDGKDNLYASFDTSTNSFLRAPSRQKGDFTWRHGGHRTEITISCTIRNELRKAAKLCDSLKRSLKMSRRKP